MSKSTIPSKRSADAQEAAWVADEDRFVLQQAKKKAVLRLKGGRAQPIDWLAVTLAVIDQDSTALGDELEDDEVDLMNPEGVLEGLAEEQLSALQKGIEGYLALETSKSSREYWNTMKTICEDRIRRSQGKTSGARGVTSVATDLDKLLGPKTLVELEKLENQIQSKLSSKEPIDTDYWEHLLASLKTYKAKAQLRQVSQSIINARLDGLRKQQEADAEAFKLTLGKRAREDGSSPQLDHDGQVTRDTFDPDPMLRLRSEDKALESTTAQSFAENLAEQRRKVQRRGYIPLRRTTDGLADGEPATKRLRTDDDGNKDSSFDREVARGMGDNEEIFATEEQVETRGKAQWASQYRPRKPKYFNRMRLGYEWNKYNQTHYDHDNPPPKVVQGYKFNVFYPDLADPTKAPTYRIERENGRKRGQTFAPAGEDDTCLIRFTAGPPYEDVAFRIIDREWDFSAKRERGFRSSFDKGILQLHFQFKKVYYRK